MKGHVTKRYLIIAALTMAGVTGRAQQSNISALPQVIPASPEAAAIAKYINYPVDYSTGLVKIEIPLYEIKAGELTLPITLSYHASGIKVNENSGWVGTGWTLNAEPMVSRSVNGNPDEKAQIGLLANNSSLWDFKQYDIRLVDGVVDEAPDDFYYRLLDRSGKFYFHKKFRENSPAVVTTNPYDPVIIKYNQLNSGLLEIISEDGVYYRFGISFNNTTWVENTTVTSGNDQNRTGWKATEVISASKADTVYFSYRTSQDYLSNPTDMIIVEDNHRGYSSPAGITGCSEATFPLIQYQYKRLQLNEHYFYH